MQLHERTIADLTAFVETLTEGQYQPVQRFVWERRFGMIAGGSVLLSEIGRQLEQDTALLSIEKRLSRQVGSDRWAERELQEGYRELVSPRVKADPVLALDIGDLTKASAQAREGLGKVWDGSEGTGIGIGGGAGTPLSCAMGIGRLPGTGRPTGWSSCRAWKRRPCGCGRISRC